MDSNTYVIVMHLESGRAFTLDRGYGLLDRHLPIDGGLPPSLEIKQRWNGWKPTAERQIPGWATAIPDKELLAVWLPDDWDRKWLPSRGESLAMMVRPAGIAFVTTRRKRTNMEVVPRG